MKEILQGAERVLIPKGDDNKLARSAFELAADIEIPTFKGEKLVASSLGRTFWLVKSKDIPELVARGYSDIGVTGEDSSLNYQIKKRQPELRRKRLGNEAMCRFSLLTYVEDREEMLQILAKGGLDVPKAVTAQPDLLRDLFDFKETMQVLPSDIQVSGSVEGVMRLVGARLAADIVASGETARENGLVELQTLLEIFPEVVYLPDFEESLKNRKVKRWIEN